MHRCAPLCFLAYLTTEDIWDLLVTVTTTQLLEQMRALTAAERTYFVEEVVRQLSSEERKSIERLVRRLQRADVPDSFWEGIEDHEDGRTLPMETALRETPPGRQ